MPKLDHDRLFPADPATRSIARDLFQAVETLPIISPHGHCDPKWFATNAAFPDPAQLFVVPDHYVVRMLVSQGIPHADLGVASLDGTPSESDPHKIWDLFAAHYHLFRGTPSKLWIDHSLERVFGVTEDLTPETARYIYDQIAERLRDDAFRPRQLFERFNIEVLATTDSALDGDLPHHSTIAETWSGRVIPTYRPDTVVDPETPDFKANITSFGHLTGCDTTTWQGYLEAHRIRRAFFASKGATATDHGHDTAQTADLSDADAQRLFEICLGEPSPEQAALFRAQMLTEMAKMSALDGLVMQLHAGSSRNHSAQVLAAHGKDMGFDIPRPTNFVDGLKPLLNTVGHAPNFKLILFTLDEATYARELAPLAGAYPSVTLGPPWWFFDSPEGIQRYRQATSETAGIYNTAGFNDDTRAFCSIPARHDMARRADCAWLATLVADHRLNRAEATEMAMALTTDLARKAYNL